MGSIWNKSKNGFTVCYYYLKDIPCHENTIKRVWMIALNLQVDKGK